MCGVPPTRLDDRVRPLGPRDQQDAVVVHVVGAVARADHRADATRRRVAEQVAHGVDRVHAHVGQRSAARERLLREPARGAPAGVHAVPAGLHDLAQLAGHDPGAHAPGRRGGTASSAPPSATRRRGPPPRSSRRTRPPRLPSASRPGRASRPRAARSIAARAARWAWTTTAASTSGSRGQGLPVGRDARDVVALGERAGGLLPVVGHGDDLVPARAHPARVEVLDPSAAEQRHPHQRTSPVVITSKSLSRRAPGCRKGTGKAAEVALLLRRP